MFLLSGCFRCPVFCRWQYTSLSSCCHTFVVASIFFQLLADICGAPKLALYVRSICAQFIGSNFGMAGRIGV